MRHLEQIHQDCRWFQSLESILDYVGVLGDYADKVDGVGFGEEGEVCGGDFGLAECGFAGDGAETCMCVLQVGTGVTFEGGHDVDIEGIVVDSEENV